jgi:hypothetical protein
MDKRVIDKVGPAHYAIPGGIPRLKNGGDDAVMVNWAPHQC